MLSRRKLRMMGMAAIAAIPFAPDGPGFAFASGTVWLCLSETRGQGREIARRPLGADNSFSLSFIHSVSDTPVIDNYRIENNEIVQISEIFEAHGAGLPSIADDMGATGLRHEEGKFILDMSRRTGPIALRIQPQYKNTLHIAGSDLPLADLGHKALTLAPCDEETPH